MAQTLNDLFHCERIKEWVKVGNVQFKRTNGETVLNRVTSSTPSLANLHLLYSEWMILDFIFHLYLYIVIIY